MIDKCINVCMSVCLCVYEWQGQGPTLQIQPSCWLVRVENRNCPSVCVTTVQLYISSQADGLSALKREIEAERNLSGRPHLPLRHKSFLSLNMLTFLTC